MMCANRGKVTFADSGTVLCHCINQYFHATFCSDLDFHLAYNNLDTGRECKVFFSASLIAKFSTLAFAIDIACTD